MTTTTTSFTLAGILGAAEGQKFKVSTDNSLYGTTVVKQNGTIINARTGEPMALTAELIRTKFRAVSDKKPVTIEEFVAAYEAGAKVEIELNGRSRFLQIPTGEEAEIVQFVKSIASKNPFHELMLESEVVTMQELMKGTFYIVE